MNKNIITLFSDTKSQETLCDDLKAHDFNVVALSSLKELDDFIATPQGELLLVQSDIDFIDINSLCTRMKSKEALKHMPILFVSNHEDDIDELVTCFDACANDYIKYPPLAQELLKRIEYHLKTKSKHEALEEKNKRLANLASNDALTKVASKVSIQSNLEQQIKYMSLTSDDALVVVYIHLGNLTKVNELLGYEKGDKYLVHIALVLQKHIEGSMQIGRWIGGDFVIILKKSSISKAKNLVHEIYKHCKQDGIIKRFKTKFYFGITQAQPKERSTTVIERAREAMTQASNGVDSFFWVL